VLLSYFLQNFHSFGERTEVSFLLNQRDTAAGWHRTTPSGRRVSTAMAVMGANAAGKTNLVKAGPFLSWFVSDSFALQPGQPLPFMPHAMQVMDPVSFEVRIEDSAGTEWTYELVTRPDRVEHESLYRKEDRVGARPVRVFTRTLVGESYEVSQELGLAQSEAVKVRPNVSLISWAKQYGSSVALQVAQLNVATNFSMWGTADRGEARLWDAATFFGEHKRLSSLMIKLLRRWDLGLSDVRLQRYEYKPPGAAEEEVNWFPIGVHQVGDREFALPFAAESSGTQTAFILLWRLLPVLEAGGVAFIDELESDLHPHMIEPILRIFHDEDTNPKGAQVIFTTHSPEILRSLHRAQVTFVDKVDCMSTAYRGDEIEGLTNQHNLYTKYLSGALGAVPQF
jgi:hypothetical protein